MDINPGSRRRSTLNLQPQNGARSFTRKQSFNLASSTPIGTPRRSFTSVRPGTSINSNSGRENGEPASSAVSAHSVDIDNPHPDVVKAVGRHLVHDADVDESSAIDLGEDDKFSSLKLQGGDVTRQIYNWQRGHEGEEAAIKRGRSRSFDLPRPHETGPMGETLDPKQIKAPGGFRRDYIITHKGPPAAASRRSTNEQLYDTDPHHSRPTIFTRNFIEYLSLYGHFAGEELEEDDDSQHDGHGPTEYTSLIDEERGAGSYRRQNKRLSEQAKGQASVTESVLLLLKSFVGTGVLFLPKAFYNGGLLFSTLVLVFVSAVSYWCFLLLIAAKEHTKVSSFGDIGGALYGPRVRQIILGAIVLSQIGFAAAYIVFVSENIQAFMSNVAQGRGMHITTLICAQLIVFLPLSMVRDIAKLGFTALVADFFILLGLIYLYSWGGMTVLTQGVADVAMFNKTDWTLFIGTAIFTYEGIGLIIPIQESMREPQKFDAVMGGVMVGITFVFVSIGALLYMACGSSVQTVILLNLPKGSHAVSTIQLLYSLAILLSTPLQLFPAIRILENGVFVRSGKYSRKVKWQKNLFRFGLVFVTGIIAYVGANDLDKFVALVGSFACVPLVYIFPPFLHKEIVPAFSRAWYLDISLIIFGIGIMIYTSISTLQSWIG